MGKVSFHRTRSSQHDFDPVFLWIVIYPPKGEIPSGLLGTQLGVIDLQSGVPSRIYLGEVVQFFDPGLQVRLSFCLSQDFLGPF